jgi:tetratricopeptide (TPR) repeat protein
MHYLKLIFLLFLIMHSATGLSQQGCNEKINQAYQLYEDGAFRTAEKAIKEILENCNLDKSKQKNLIKLLANVYYEMDEIELAQEYLSKLKKDKSNKVSEKKAPKEKTAKKPDKAKDDLPYECKEKIEQAYKEYEDGTYRIAEKTIKNILDSCKLDKTKQREMIKLLTSVYFELDEIEVGQQYMSQFIKKNPYYSSSKKNDPVPFNKAMDNIVSFPRFSLALEGGTTLGFISTKKIYPVLNVADYFQPVIAKPIFQGGLEFSWHLNTFFFLGTGAGVRMQGISHHVPIYRGVTFNYNENSTTTYFPLSIGFSIPLGRKFAVQLYGGGELELFTSAKYSFSYSSDSVSTDGLPFMHERQKSNIKIAKEARNEYRLATMAGLKFLFKIEQFGVFADAKYIKEMDLYTNPGERYTDPNLWLSNRYFLSDIMFENIDISVGIVYHFSYKVKSKF